MDEGVVSDDLASGLGSFFVFFLVQGKGGAIIQHEQMGQRRR